MRVLGDANWWFPPAIGKILFVKPPPPTAADAPALETDSRGERGDLRRDERGVLADAPSSDELRLRRKCTPTKYRPGAAVLATVLVHGEAERVEGARHVHPARGSRAGSRPAKTIAPTFASAMLSIIVRSKKSGSPMSGRFSSRSSARFQTSSRNSR